MVRKFPWAPVYPGGFDPREFAAHQSAVPSQNSPVPPPYYPATPTDLQTLPSGAPASELSIVRSSFDVRPPQAYDFVFTDVFSGGVPTFGGLQVPTGFVLILRRISMAAFPTGEAVPGYMTPWGDLGGFGGVPQVQLLVDNNGGFGGGAGNAAPWQIPNGPFGGPPGVNGQLIPDVLLGGAAVDVFVVLGEGRTCSIFIPGITDNANFNAYATYEGNLLLSTGRNPPLEVGNPDPLPVTQS